jgi:hypothetical protein
MTDLGPAKLRMQEFLIAKTESTDRWHAQGVRIVGTF